ncbi:MAG: hemerythrin domain-containing protein [Actinomycetota bacterium]|nr:hemerythrin domain-containing protein [Actinomycetota bacterium]
MNALELLKQDHRRLEGLLSDLESTSEGDTGQRQELFSTVRGELRVHEILEEEILYPALKEHSEARGVVLEGIEEHNVADRLLGDMGELSVQDEAWGAKLAVLKENLEHHIEEEEGEMFVKAEDIFEDDQLEEMGQRMERRKEEAEAEAA